MGQQNLEILHLNGVKSLAKRRLLRTLQTIQHRPLPAKLPLHPEQTPRPTQRSAVIEETRPKAHVRNSSKIALTRLKRSSLRLRKSKRGAVESRPRINPCRWNNG